MHVHICWLSGLVPVSRSLRALAGLLPHNEHILSDAAVWDGLLRQRGRAEVIRKGLYLLWPERKSVIR